MKQQPSPDYPSYSLECPGTAYPGTVQRAAEHGRIQSRMTCNAQKSRLIQGTTDCNLWLIAMTNMPSTDYRFIPTLFVLTCMLVGIWKGLRRFIWANQMVQCIEEELFWSISLKHATP